jgi:hypothetical protein
MKNTRFLFPFIILSLFIVFFCFQVLPAEAVSLKDQITNNIDAGTNSSGLGRKDIRATVASFIKIALSTIGIIFTTLTVISGYNILTAGGDESKIEKAKKTIQACVIGLLITMSAYSITSFVTKSSLDAVNGTVEQSQDTRLRVDTVSGGWLEWLD